MGQKNRIPDPRPSNEAKIKFSFEYYDTDGPKYCISNWNEKEIRLALTRLKDVNSKSYLQLVGSRRVYHFGEVDWTKTKEPRGFPNLNVNRLPPFHFALLGVNGQLARVYGAFSTGTFYIVWFDLNHEIWPTLLRYT